MKKANPAGPTATVSLLREDDWARWLEIDDNLHDTFQEYKAAFDKHMAGAGEQGHQFTIVEVQIDEFLEWWRTNPMKPISSARAAYAVAKATGAKQVVDLREPKGKN